MSSSAFLAVATVGVTAATYYHYGRSKQSLSLPPGPAGDWIIGNLRQMPTSYPWLTYAEWGRKYGPLTYINVAGISFLILNSHEAAVELLEKRAEIYSGRPVLAMAEMSGQQASTVLLPAGNAHRQGRKLLAHALQPRVVKRDFAPLQERLARQLCVSLLEDPDAFMTLIYRSQGEVIQTITYGDFKDGETDLVELSMTNAKNLVTSVSGYAVNFLPWLRYLPDWFPGTRFKSEAAEFRRLAHDAVWKGFDMVKRQATTGIAPTSFVSAALEDKQADEETIAGAAFTLFGAGSETISSALAVFILAMVLYPDVQARVRAELDHIFGDRLPNVESHASTPYLNAVILETLRWHPTLPAGLPHLLKQDDVYKGYHIPAGTLVLFNTWGILHDEKRFPNHATFNPDRYLPGTHGGEGREKDVQDSDNAPLSPWVVAFGYGRRSCQGIPLVESGLWIAMATILSTFEILPKTDPKTMKPVIPDEVWEDGPSR
ncbi:hypothetical protein FRB97_003494 [Tulasnella sp. 331]|nr:hypothetical protein FRB97_003494 [Tulasnella sp. 331]KAG8889683.1 hypothetical protein FRB98_003246 [Tulasnella sp. 332]